MEPSCIPLLLFTILSLLNTSAAKSVITPADRIGGEDDEILVPMRSFLHIDTLDYLLFKSFAAQSQNEYVAVCVSAAFIAFSSVAMQSVTPQFEQRWREEFRQTRVSSRRYRLALRRAIWNTAAYLLSSFVMLIVMSFNVGIICSVLAGHFFGIFFLRRTAGANEEALEALLSPPTMAGRGHH